MPLINRSALVPYAAEAMYHLVNDIERYPTFLPWCSSTHILSANDHEIIASIDIAKGPLRGTLTTRNQLNPYQYIHLELVSGPFKTWKGYWQFESCSESSCRVHLHLQFEFISTWASALFNPIFQGIANTFVSAFCERARNLYG